MNDRRESNDEEKGNGYFRFTFDAEFRTYYLRRRKGSLEGIIHRVKLKELENQNLKPLLFNKEKGEIELDVNRPTAAGNSFPAAQKLKLKFILREIN